MKKSKSKANKSKAVEYLAGRLSHSSVEEMWLMTAKGLFPLQVGNGNSVEVILPEILIRVGNAPFVVVHNHPGESTPRESAADVEMYTMLRQYADCRSSVIMGEEAFVVLSEKEYKVYDYILLPYLNSSVWCLV